jgi:hypothetical protein
MRVKLVAGVCGALVGALLLHPYSMIGYRLLMSDEPVAGFGEIWAWALQGLSFHMWPMTLFYAFFGAVMGYGLALLWEKNSELVARQMLRERQQAVQQMLQEVTMTVAHHILNANSVIGGHTRRMAKKHAADEELARKLAIVVEASAQIDAVVGALQALDSNVEKEEIGATQLRMLDIRDAVQKRIAASSLAPRPDGKA